MAEKFNMQGGYFSPQGYMRIDTGGSHDENPNGGVQIGVDEQNIPNMLEEDESVYKDYVFSDNIRADKKFLIDNHIPEKYAGKLYSEIADAYVAEVEDRPLDTISNKGLNAMLMRLAQAQEAQKEEKTVSELEKEIAQLTPDELNELETMLGNTEQGQVEQPSVPEMVPQPVSSVEQVSQPQMMAEGGVLRRFEEGGGDGDLVAYGGTLPDAVATATHPFTARVSQAGNNFLKKAKEVFDEAKAPLYFVPGIGEALLASDAVEHTVKGEYDKAVLSAVPAIKPAKGVAKVMDEAYRILEAEKAAEAARKAAEAAETVKKGSKIKDAAKKTWNVSKYIFDPRAVWKSGWKPTTTGGKVGKGVVGTVQTLGSTALDLELVNQGVSTAIDQLQQRTGNNTESAYEDAKETDPFANTRARGGRINRYDTKIGSNLLQRGSGFNGTVTAQDVIRRHFPAVQLDLSGIDTSDVQDVLMKLPESPTTTTSNVPLLSRPLFQSPTYKANVALTLPKLTPLRDDATVQSDVIKIVPDIRTAASSEKQESADAVTATGNTAQPAMLSTWPRYTGALTSGIMGLYNAFQKPDQYEIRRYNPVLPSAKLHLVDPTYNPMDQNLLVNDVLATNAGTVRALQNSGLGPSAGVAILAADYNTGRNLGDARAKVWDANNQRRNEVLTQRNANAKAASDFDYAMSRDRARILNAAESQNIQNDLMQQRLNYAAEGEKYAALQSNIDALSQALSGIGKENFAMNQVNQNSAYDYVILPGGGYAYMPKTKKENSDKNGGLLMRPYKKK